MFRWVVVALLQLYIFNSLCVAQNGSIQGVVRDESDMPIEFANVYLDSVFISAITQSNGAFEISGVKPGRYTLKVSRMGYKQYQQNIAVGSEEQIVYVFLKSVSDTLSPVVVTGTGTRYRLSDVPVHTEIITQKEIQEISSRNTEDIIAGITSSFDFISSSMGTNIKLDGLGSGYVLVLIDGKRMTGTVGGVYDFDRINPDDIQQIEIVKGAASTLYGSDAIAGVINIITKKSAQELSVTNSTRIGAYNDLRQQNVINFSNGKVKSKTVFQYKQTDGWQLNDMEFNHKWEDNHDLDSLVHTYDMPVNKKHSYSVNQHIDYAINNPFSVYADLSWYDKMLYFPYKGRGYNYHYINLGATIGGKYQLKNNNYIDFNADFGDFLYYSEYPHKYNETYVTSDGIEKVTYYPGDCNKESEQINVIAQAKGVFHINNKNTLNVGVEFFGDFLEAQYRLTDEHVHALTNAVFLQDEFKLTDDFNIVGGVRLIYHSKFGFMATPKLAAMYKIKPITFRINYAHGFKSPTLKELYYYYESDRMGMHRIYYGNEDLDPQVSNYYSTTVELKHGAFKTSVTGYVNRLKDMIEYEIIPTTYDERRRGVEESKKRYNIEDAQNVGFDFHASIKLMKQLNISGGYSYVDAKNVTLNIRLNGISEHSANWKASWNKNWNKYSLGISLSGQYKSDKFYLEEDDDEEVRSYADPYQLWNLTTNHQLKSIEICDVKISAGIDNVLDYVDESPYGSHYGTLNPGRTYFAGLNIKWKK